uniref:Uncharacterized protein n=1 Tax=Oryza meridionalis TaxID=40149 RepID=A0A0E0F567_9ORYZ
MVAGPARLQALVAKIEGGSSFYGTRRGYRGEDLPRDGGTTKLGGVGGAEKKLQHAYNVFDEMCRRVKKREREEDELVRAGRSCDDSQEGVGRKGDGRGVFIGWPA